MSKWLCMLIIPIILGCNKPGRVEFVAVCNDHQDLTTETNTALINSVKEKIQEIIDRSQNGEPLDADAIVALEDLSDRLTVIMKQSELINRYVMTHEVDEQLIAELIRYRWRTAQ